jgi:ADP-ribose pyrophosphatase YjhB (NUDIX family)
MGNYYQGAPRHLIAVDCVIFGYEEEQLKLLLFPRIVEPAQGEWSLLGGFVNENESTDDSAIRVLQYTTGLTNIFMEQVKTFSEPLRDPGARVISNVYFALIRIDRQDDRIIQEHGAKWWPITQFPQLIFDHDQMVAVSLARLQMKAGLNLIGHELLPDFFTLRMLRKLYEAIFQRPLDPGNFRKKVLSIKVLQKSEVKEKTNSKKGAYFYQFNKEVEQDNGNLIFKL